MRKNSAAPAEKNTTDVHFTVDFNFSCMKWND